MSAKIETGSISHGTLRTADLLNAFAVELQRIFGQTEETREALARAKAIEDGRDETESDSDLVAALQDALDDAAPAGMYFGTLEGDGSDFGFWLNEDGSRAALAREFSLAFERRTRDNGDEFVCLKDGSPEWIKEAIHAAHGDMMPDDWRYRLIESVVDGIADALSEDCTADLDDARPEIIDGAIPIYNAERLQWLASRLDRAEYCDNAVSEGLVLTDESNMFERIAAGMYMELEEIWQPIVDALNDAAE